MGLSFNKYLRISENKFTENKMAQAPEEEVANTQAEKAKKVKLDKPKIDLLKEAASIGIKNIEIKEEGGEEIDRDTMSIAGSEISAGTSATSVFKSAKLPAYFFTREFRETKYMNLFNPNDIKEF